MAGEDYSVKTKVTADVSNFEKGMNKAEKSLKGFSDKLANSINRLGKKGLVGSLGSVGLALGGITSAVGIATKAIKKVSQAIGECTEAFREQNKAEIALETAVKNNPYIDGSSINGLKQFAGEMQRVSEIGDEQFLPMMAQLIATGRTEAETMDIIKVATDMSATGTMSFETAIQQLNATLNGNIGRLGLQNSELKNLTEEELKSGKAVEILGNKFKGLAEATADTSKQLKNAIGDFKELIGESFEKALSPMRKYFTEIITKTNNAISKAREHKKAVADVFNDEGDVKTGSAQTTNLQQSLIELQKEYERAYKDQQQYLKLYGQYIDQTTDATALAYERDIKSLEDKIKKITDELLIRKKASDEEKKQAEAQKTQAEKEKEIADLKDKYLKKIAEQEAKWANIALITKEEVTNEEKLKFYQEQLVGIMTEAGGQISTNNQYYKDQMKVINDLITKIAENPSPSSEWIDRLKEQRIEALEDERDRAIQFAEDEGEETYSIWRYYNEKILELKLERLEKEKEKALEEEGLTADDKIKVEEYYSGETKKIYDELGQYKKKKDKEEYKDLKDKIKDKIKLIGTYAKEVSKVLNKIGKVIKAGFTAYIKVIDNAIKIATKMLKTAFDVFTKLINFNISDALDILLKFEDSVLSFFVETLPQLPQFVSTVLKSINTMLSTLINSVKAENIATVIYGILDELANNLPNIVQNILTIIQNMISFSNENLADIVYKFLKILEENAIPVVEGLLDLLTNVIKDSIDGLFRWLDEGGLQSLLKLALKIQTSVQDVFMKLLTSVADLLENHTGDVTKFISDSLQKAMEDLPKLVDALLRIVNSLIKSVADLFKDKKFVDTMVQSMIDTFNSLMDRLPDIIGSVVDLILSLITALVPKLPEIILAVITKIVETIPKIINEIVGKIGAVISDIFSRIFTAEFWQDVFGKIGEGFKKIFESLGKGLEEAFTKGGYGKNSTGSTVGDMAVDLLVPFGFLRHFFADGTNNAPSGLAVVGEAGPELVKFRGGEQVLNNRNTNKALANMGGTTINQNVTFNNLQDTSAYAMMNQLKQYNRQMAINGVI